jgi:importin-11
LYSFHTLGAYSLVITPQEKHQLKQKMLLSLNEPCNAVAVQIAVAIAFAARIELARNRWEELLPAIHDALQSSNPLLHRRGLSMLHEILQELSMRRLMLDRTDIGRRTEHITTFIQQQWLTNIKELMSKFSAVLSAGATPSADVLAALSQQCDSCWLITECLRYLLVCGAAGTDPSQDTYAYFDMLHKVVRDILVVLDKLPQSSGARESLLHVLESMISSIVVMQFDHAIMFRNWLGVYTELMFDILKGSFTPQGSYRFDIITCKALEYVSHVITSAAYNDPQRFGAAYSASTRIQFDHKSAEEAKHIRDSIINKDFLREFVRLLVSQFFVLRVQDMEDWEDDPEEFVSTDYESEPFLRVRSGAHEVFSNVVDKHTDTVGPMVVDVLKFALSQSPPTCDPPEIGSTQYQHMCFKEAVYQAMGLKHFQLEPAFKAAGFHFGSFFSSTLVHELSSQHPHLKIIRRRVMWLIGQWVEAIPNELRRQTYTVVNKQLCAPDLAERLSASGTLFSLVSDMNYRTTVEQCVPLFPDLVKNLFATAKDCRSLNLKGVVVQAIQSLAEHTPPPHFVPLAQLISQHLPALWKVTSELDPLRVSIVRIFIVLVSNLHHQSIHLHGAVIPLLRYSLENALDNSAFIVEYIFDLWEMVLKNTPVLTDDLRSLMVFWERVIRQQLRLVEQACSIVSSYALLGGNAFMSKFGGVIAGVFEYLYHETRPRIHRDYLNPSLQVIADMFPAQFPSAFGGILKMMIDEILTPAYLPPSQQQQQQQQQQQNCSHKPIDRPMPNENYVGDDTVVSYLPIFGRILYQGSAQTMTLLRQLSNGNEYAVLAQLMDVWVDKMDIIYPIYTRKMCLLALSTSIVCGHPAIVQRLPLLIDCTVTCLDRLENTDDAGDLIPDFSDARNVPENERTEDIRKLLMFNRDPSLRADLRKFLTNVMRQAAGKVGPDNWNNVLQSIGQQSLHELEHGLPPKQGRNARR